MTGQPHLWRAWAGHCCAGRGCTAAEGPGGPSGAVPRPVFPCLATPGLIVVVVCNAGCAMASFRGRGQLVGAKRGDGDDDGDVPMASVAMAY